MQAALGVELSAAGGGRAPYTLWGPIVAGAEDFRDVELHFGGLAGYDQMRLVVAARGAGDGWAGLDDVSLVTVPKAVAPAASYGDEFRLHLFGSPPNVACMSRAREVVLAGLRVRGPQAGEGQPRWTTGSLEARSSPKGMTLGIRGAAAGSELVFAAQVSRDDGAEQGTGFVATIGPEGYQAYSAGFEGVRADALLLGRGFDLLRVSFPSTVTLSAAPAGGALAGDRRPGRDRPRRPPAGVPGGAHPGGPVGRPGPRGPAQGRVRRGPGPVVRAAERLSLRGRTGGGGRARARAAAAGRPRRPGGGEERGRAGALLRSGATCSA